MIITVFKIWWEILCSKDLNKYIAVNYIRQNCRNSVFTSCKMRKENIISQAEMYNFDRKKFCGKFELSLVFWFSIWLLVTTAEVNKPDLSSWIYLYPNTTLIQHLKVQQLRDNKIGKNLRTEWEQGECWGGENNFVIYRQEILELTMAYSFVLFI